MIIRNLTFAAATLLSGLTLGLGTASAATAPAATFTHTVNCVTVNGKPYLGDPGASGQNKNDTCQFWFNDEVPSSDGPVLILKSSKGVASTFSIVKLKLAVPSKGTSYIATDHHGETSDCVTVNGTPYLGDPGASGKNKNEVCQFWFSQEIPSSDGVIVSLETTAGKVAKYSIVKPHFATPPQGQVRIPWGPAN